MSKSYKTELKRAIKLIQFRIDEWEKYKLQSIKAEEWSKVPSQDGIIVGLILAHKECNEHLPRRERIKLKSTKESQS